MAYANVTTPRDKGIKDGNIISLPMAAETIYKGSLVEIDASGYAAALGIAASRPFAGVAYETVANTVAGSKEIRVWTTGIHNFKYPAGDAATALLGKAIYWDTSADSDPQSVDDADQGTGPIIGRLVGIVSASEVEVLIDGYAMNVDGQAN